MNNERINISQGFSPPEYDIPNLVQRSQEGDSQAVATLYSLHYQRIYTFAFYRLNGDVPLAEDVTEEVFIRAFRMIGTFRWKGVSFGAWLVTIARNLIVDHLRRPEDLPLEETWLDSSIDPAKIVEQEMTHKEMFRALQKLTPDQKDVIVLRFFEDFSLAETAKITGKTIEAVKRLQARALTTLGDGLSRYKP